MGRGVFSKKISLLIVGFALLCSARAYGYHHFIGYGYTACMTCHYNGAGGGPLNDYGRALFATEITSRWVYPKTMSEDRIAELSKFLVTKDLPFWFRPSIKTRSLEIETNPRSGSPQKRWVPMQKEIQAAFQDRDQKYVFVASVTENEKPRGFTTGTENKDGGVSLKEAYGRAQVGETQWVYLGQLDKVFGIREVDHSAFSRRWPGVAQYDQSVGLIYNGTFQPLDWNFGVFTGNTAEEADVKQKGFSAMVEYEPVEKLRFGLSVMSEKSERERRNAYAIHEKMGIGRGNALSAEAGIVEIEDLVKGTDRNTRAYGLLQSFIRITRGYNFLGQVQWARSDIMAGSAHTWVWEAGLVTFPLPRTEFRISGVKTGNFRDENAQPENWAMLWQLHLSL